MRRSGRDAAAGARAGQGANSHRLYALAAARSRSSVGRRRPARVAGDRAAQDLEVEQRALAPRRRDRDAEQVDQPLAVELGDLRDRHADVLLGGDRRRRLGDRAALPVEAQLGDLPALDADVDAHLVAAQRVVVVRLEVVRLELAEVPRPLVVLEDVVAVQVVHQPANTSRARATESSSASTSSGTLYGPNDARAVAATPSLRMSTWAQWCPARTQTLSRLSRSAMSCGCMPSMENEMTPPRSSTLGGPTTVTPSIACSPSIALAVSSRSCARTRSMPISLR